MSRHRILSPHNGASKQEGVNEMSYTQTEIIGFAENFLKLVDQEEALLKEKGLDVELIREDVSGKKEKASTANARQEDQKRELKDSTKEVEATHDDLYRSTSGYMDACIGVVGKGSTAAKNFRRLRSRIRMPVCQPLHGMNARVNCKPGETDK